MCWSIMVAGLKGYSGEVLQVQVMEIVVSGC